MGGAEPNEWGHHHYRRRLPLSRSLSPGLGLHTVHNRGYQGRQRRTIKKAVGARSARRIPPLATTNRLSHQPPRRHSCSLRLRRLLLCNCLGAGWESAARAGGCALQIAPFAGESQPGLGHLSHLACILRTDRILTGDRPQGPEPEIRSALEFTKDQRQDPRPQADDPLIRRMHGHLRLRREVSLLLPPLPSEFLKGPRQIRRLLRCRWECFDRCHFALL